MTVQPPDPEETVAAAKGEGAVSPGSPTISGSISGEPSSMYRRYERAADPNLEHFHDETGRGIGVSAAMGAIDLAGPGDLTRKQVAAGVTRSTPGDVVFGEMLKAGPYEALAYADEYGASSTVSDFYRDQASRHLREEGFYEGRGYGYANYGEEPGPVLVSSVGRSAAPITQSPTSTTNLNRPRTVAAGYDRARKVLTTVFRDGTFYNYYGVDNLEWGNFIRSRSKGRYIITSLNNKVRGLADVGAVPQSHQELLYKAARTSQVIKGGYTGTQKVGSKRGTGGKYAYGRPGTSTSGGRAYRAAKGTGRYTGK